MVSNNNLEHNFTIRDNSSEFAKYLPKKYIEPLTIIARIKGYKGIDDYNLELIKDRVEMFTDTRDTIENEDFQEYMHNTMIGKDVENPWARIIYQEDEEQEGAITTTKKIIEESKEEEENVSDFVKKVHNEYLQKSEQEVVEGEG